MAMAVSDERREDIARFAEGGHFNDLTDEEFDALTEDDYERASDEFFAAITDPEELHIFVGEYNWDGGVDDLLRAIRHRLCDQGTTLLTYWRGQPTYYLQYADRAAVPAHEIEVYDLLREIEQRMASGAFATATQPFDPADDDGVDCRPSAADIEQHGRDLPAIMYQPVPARG